jgi:serine/threonine protein phosphatase PrpC
LQKIAENLPLTINIDFFEANNIGKRSYNQDDFAHVVTDQFACFVVADGLGGHQHGEIASMRLCEALIKEAPNYRAEIYKSKLEGLEPFLMQSYELMRQVILTEYGSIDTHTTFVLAWLDDSQLLTAHVGDSRLYRINKEAVVWRTPDHTQVQTLFMQGKVSEDDMGKHPLQNQLSRTVNLQDFPDIEIFAHPALSSTETLVLCTDGFWTDTPLQEMVRLANERNYRQEFQARISELAEHPFADNITVQVIKQT